MTSTKQPFQESSDLELARGDVRADAAISVPAGKRLVIEYVSAIGFVPSGQSLSFSILTKLGNAPEKEHFLLTQKTSSGSYVASQLTRIYADSPQATVRVDLNSPSDGGYHIKFTISGSLMDVGSTPINRGVAARQARQPIGDPAAQERDEDARDAAGASGSGSKPSTSAESPSSGPGARSLDEGATEVTRVAGVRPNTPAWWPGGLRVSPGHPGEIPQN